MSPLPWAETAAPWSTGCALSPRLAAQARALASGLVPGEGGGLLPAGRSRPQTGDPASQHISCFSSS